MILLCQSKYYPIKIDEISNRINILNNLLKNFEFERKMKEYTEMSIQILKAEL